MFKTNLIFYDKISFGKSKYDQKFFKSKNSVIFEDQAKNILL